MKNHYLSKAATKIKESGFWKKSTFIILGILSTIWFLVRVIPKPSRATYPCMKAAAPFMSSFIIYILTLGGIPLLFKKSVTNFKKARYWSAFAAISITFVLLIAFNLNDTENIYASIFENKNYAIEDTPNDPMGEGKGIHPGRVAWVMDKDATNEDCNNKSNDYWFMDDNTDQDVVSTMLADGIKVIAGKKSLTESWDDIFKYFNNTKGKGKVGYVSGEKIVIKLNYTTMGNGGRTLKSAMNSTPQLSLSLLQELIDSLGVAESDITIGDPYRGMPDALYDLCYDEYPNVHYIEGKGTDGREKTEINDDDVFFNSDDEFQSRLPQAYIDASYLINMPCLKTHNSAGITIAAKNHQGSVIGPDQSASNQSMLNYLHYDYPVDGGSENQKMGIYRHIVDFMAHERLGGNTLVYIVDAIWSGRNWDAKVDKFGMSPFDNDWTSSLLISQDAVAIESVGFDFLYNEYKDYPALHGNDEFPLIAGVQDYIHQAADPSNWPAGIAYDPNTPNHSSPVASLGVHEHWNNSEQKQYSRNLGENKGIELVGVPSTLVASTSTSLEVLSNIGKNNSLSIYPNPIKDIATLKYTLSTDANVSIQLLSIDGKIVISKNNIQQLAGQNTFRLSVSEANLAKGIYICKVIAKNKTVDVFTSKITINN